MATVLLMGCASEQTIRTQCTLPGPCFCDADCVEPDSDEPTIQCPAPRVYDVPTTYTIDIGGTGCDAIVEMWGGGGGGGVAEGGGGAYAQVNVFDLPRLTMQVGFGGEGGGAPDGGGGGGSATWVYEPGIVTLAVAAGGGGGAGSVPQEATEGFPAPAQTGTDGAPGTSGTGSLGGTGGFAAVGYGGRGGDSNGGGGGGGGSTPGIGGGPAQPGTTGGSWSRDNNVRQPSGVQVANADGAAGAGRGGAPNTDGSGGRIVIRFEPPSGG